MSDIEQQLLRLRASTRQMLREELELSPHRTLSVLADELLCESMYRRIGRRTYEPRRTWGVDELFETPSEILIEQSKIQSANALIKDFDSLLEAGELSVSTHNYWKKQVLFLRDGEGDG